METYLAPAVHEALLKGWEPIDRSRLHYLVTWSTRGRRPVLKDRHVETIRSLVSKACEERSIDLIEVVVGTDHVHVLMGLTPTQSVAASVREVKGRASMDLLQRHPELRVWLRGNLVWDERYAVETVNSARLEAVRDRLRHTHQESFLPEVPEHEDWADAS